MPHDRHTTGTTAGTLFAPARSAACPSIVPRLAWRCGGGRLTLEQKGRVRAMMADESSGGMARLGAIGSSTLPRGMIGLAAGVVATVAGGITAGWPLAPPL